MHGGTCRHDYCSLFRARQPRCESCSRAAQEVNTSRAHAGMPPNAELWTLCEAANRTSSRACGDLYIFAFHRHRELVKKATVVVQLGRMIGTRQIRASALTTSACLWEAIDTTAREYVLKTSQQVAMGQVSQKRAYGLCERQHHAPAQLCAGHSQVQGCSMFPAICRGLNTAPDSSAASEAPNATAGAEAANRRDSASAQSTEMDEDSLKRLLLDKALSHVVHSAIWGTQMHV